MNKPRFAIVGKGALCEAVLEALNQHQALGHCQVVGLLTEEYLKQNVSKINDIAILHAPKGLQEARILSHIQNLWQVDALIIASWGEYIQAQTLQRLAPIQVWNLHPSVLPAHRGINPYLASVLSGETQGGLTLHQMTSRWDEGEILAQVSFQMNPEADSPQWIAETIAHVPILFEHVISQIQKVGMQGFIEKSRPQAIWGSSVHRLALITQTQLNWDSPLNVMQRQIRAIKGWGHVQLALSHGFFVEVKGLCSDYQADALLKAWHPLSQQFWWIQAHRLYWKTHRIPMPMPLMCLLFSVLKVRGYGESPIRRIFCVKTSRFFVM